MINCIMAGANTYKNESNEYALSYICEADNDRGGKRGEGKKGGVPTVIGFLHKVACP